MPVPGDYNGDGLMDIAVWRPSSGTWFVRGQFTRQWGAAGDFPLALDSDGDGRSELVVYRGFGPDVGFRSLDPQTSVETITLFGSLDIPVLTPPWLTAARAGDMDGDRRADPTVYRPSTSEWVSRLSTNNGEVVTQFGSAGDTPVPGHYRPFRFNRPAVYRPSSGQWRFSVLDSFASESNALPVPADYDGDTTTDPATWQPSTGNWVLHSLTTPPPATIIHWGMTGDVPVPGDYDGDRRADLALYRPSTGDWYVLMSSTNYSTYFAVNWGLTDDRPVPGDYDGDGRMDIAVWRPSTGGWFQLLSSTNYTSFTTAQWGVSTDIPIAADYNGDGKTDITVFRPGTGTWFVQGGATVVLGMNGDIPLPRTP